MFIGYARYFVAYLEECLKGAMEDSGQSAGTMWRRSRRSSRAFPGLQSYVPMLRAFWKRGVFGEPARRYFDLMDRFGGVSPLLSPS